MKSTSTSISRSSMYGFDSASGVHTALAVDLWPYDDCVATRPEVLREV